MAYLKPSLFARKVFNPIALRMGWFDNRALLVPRRHSGEPQRVPVIPVEVGGVPHVVSTRGESEWVRNVRAAGRCEIQRGGETRAYQTIELPVAERAPIIDAYRAKAGSSVETYWKQLPDAGDHPVFRLEPDAG